MQNLLEHSSGNTYAKFENLLLGNRNQTILQQAFVQLCHLFHEKVPKHFKLLILNKSIVFYKKLAMQHQYRLNKFSWTNIQILNELIKSLETSKSYWLKLALAKEIKAGNYNNNFLKDKNNKEEKLMYKDLSEKLNLTNELKQTKPKLLSDLYEY